jgi:hypothetical protein
MTTPIPVPISDDDFGAGKTTMLDHGLATAAVSVDGASNVPVSSAGGSFRAPATSSPSSSTTTGAPRRSRRVFIGHHATAMHSRAGIDALPDPARSRTPLRRSERQPATRTLRAPHLDERPA